MNLLLGELGRLIALSSGALICEMDVVRIKWDFICRVIIFIFGRGWGTLSKYWVGVSREDSQKFWIYLPPFLYAAHLSPKFSADLGWGRIQIKFKTLNIVSCHSIFRFKALHCIWMLFKIPAALKHPLCWLHGEKLGPLVEQNEKYSFPSWLKIFSVEY